MLLRISPEKVTSFSGRVERASATFDQRIRASWLAVVASACCIGIGMPSIAVAAPDEDEVLQALEQVRADPNLSPQRKTRVLKWANDAKVERKERSGWLKWIAGLFAWLSGASRIVLWSAIVVFVGFLVLFIVRILRNAEYSRRPRAPDAPTHVRQLDIRPESLPDDIGAEALELWERQEHRAALILLYRGLLSRLVHVHSVPIRDSSTEADCLKLAALHLHADVALYTTRLVRVWQHAVYGARQPATDEIRALCSHFNRTLPGLARASGEYS